MRSTPSIVTLTLIVGRLLACATGATAQPVHETGTLPSGFPYQITVPKAWNGVVVSDLDAAANVGGDLATYLLQHGYAYVGTGRHPERMTRHDPLTELEAQVAVLERFTSRFGHAKHRIQYGCSGGGFIALAMAERHPDRIDGAVSFNARGTGGLAVANTWLDLPFALKALLAPTSDLLVAPVPSTALPAAYDRWRDVLEAGQKTPEGRARIALAVALAQWPTWGSIGGAPPRPAEGDLEALQRAMFVSASDGLRNAITRRQLYDNPEGLASWNTGIDYARNYAIGADPEQKKVVLQLYQRAGLGDEAGITADLARVNAQPRINGTAGGVRYWLAPGRLLSGDVKVPVVHVHGLGDALLPPQLTAGYAAAVASRGKQDLYRQGFIDAAGHCATGVAEGLAAIRTVVARLETGTWPDTSAAALNSEAQRVGLDTPRFVRHVFATPFNRAFEPGSPHPW